MVNQENATSLLAIAMASVSTQVVSPSTLLPNSSTSGWKYLIFLSFTSTEQNQTNFVTSLCRELSLKGISSIKDEGKSLEKERTCKEIEESRFLIVVLSENYVSSVQCLDLLVKIMNFWERMRKLVVPIFYNVDPCDLRNQTGRVAEAFIKHEENFTEDMEKVKEWKDALTKVASICGWDISQWEEAIIIEKIVRDISDKIVYKSSSDTSDLVGMGGHIKEMEKELCLNSNAVHMVGIWGMGGIGKTTIAKIIYDMLSTHFEVHCFLANVKENFEKYGAAALLQQLFSKVLMDERNLYGRTFTASFNFIKMRLRLKKVLLVLDDVDDWKQLEALAREPNWFGQGSRIIITTRDKHLLDAHGVQSIYEVHYLKTDQALQLLSQYAFKQNNPKLEYLELSKQFTSYAKGLPLALRVLGSFLNDRSVLEWQSVQHKLAMIPDLKIHDVLRVSFDGLDDDTQKDVFLDIACFFNGQKKEFVSEILEACGFFPDIAFAVLKDRALITISDNELSMHELLQEMGQEIVREESREEPGKRSRLWITDDVYQVLTKNKGTEIVEGMFLDTSKVREMHLNSEAFVKMYNLRLLKFYNAGSKSMSEVHLPDQGLHSFSNKLRLFHWEGYPSKSLPAGFHAENLVELHLVGSNVEQLWTGVQCLVNLKRIDLSYSKYLTTIPDLSKAQNLERLELGTCQNLVQVSPSVQFLNKLGYLNLSNCKSLHCLWDVINLKYLKALILTSCSNLTKLPEISGDIRFLCLSDTAIEELPQSIGSLCSLANLSLKKCTRLKKLPSSITGLTSLTAFFLSGCLNISKFPEIPENVECLDLSGTAIEEVPSSIWSLSRLSVLNLSNCKKLITFSSSICKLECLRRLHLSGCSKLENFHNWKSLLCLQVLDLSNCYLSKFPSNLSDLSSLEDLDLSKNNFEKVPTSIKHLSKLKLLNVSHCQKLKFFLEIPPLVTVLKACNCTSLETVPCIKSLLDRTVECWDFANCFKLSQKQTNKIVEDAQRSFLCMTAALNQVNGNKHDCSQFRFPGSEIPEWLCYKDFGPLLTFVLSSNRHQLMGIAFCVVISCEVPTLVRNVSCKCHFKASKGECDDLIFISHYWSSNEKSMALYSDNTFLWSVITENCINEYYEASFEFSASDDSKKLVAMRKCGIQLFYAEETKGSSLLDAADNNFCVISSDSGESIMREDTNTGIKRGSSKISGLEEVEPKHKRFKKCSA